jgi:hypothetical protein
MNCEECLKMMDAYEVGDLDDSGIREIEAHAESCPSCKAAIDARRKTEMAVRDAFKASTSPAAARDKVLARLSDAPYATAVSPRLRAKWWPVPVAAAAALVIGIFVGAAVSRSGGLKEPDAAPAAMTIAKIDGVVLRKHKDAPAWTQITPQAKLYVGDEMQTLAGSTLVLALKDNSTMSLNAGTNLLVKEYNGASEFVLSSGSLRATLTSPHPPFAIRTPQGLIRALGTDFAVTVE